MKKCYANENSTKQCTGEYCAADLYRQNEKAEIERHCIVNKYMGIYYTLYHNLQSRNNEEELAFTCNYNLCNNQSNSANVISKFDVHYQINDVLKTINSHKQSEESEEELETTTTTTAITAFNSITTTTTTTTFKSTTTTTTTITFKSTTTTTTTATSESTTNSQGNSGFKDTIHVAIFYILLIRFVLLY